MELAPGNRHRPQVPDVVKAAQFCRDELGVTIRDYFFAPTAGGD